VVEPISPAAWDWYHAVVGGGRCPIVDTWWQTETGAIMVAPVPGITRLKLGSCALPFFGVRPVVLDEQGREVPPGTEEKLFLSHSWPAMVRTSWKDDARSRQQYWSEHAEYYFVGDGTRIDEYGYLCVSGRIDDVVNVLGHRIGTAEVESALGARPAAAKCVVVGRPDELKGTALVCFVVLRAEPPAKTFDKELRNMVSVTSVLSLAPTRCASWLPYPRSAAG
jgi:acetyl-CoA synthetase